MKTRPNASGSPIPPIAMTKPRFHNPRVHRIWNGWIVVGIVTASAVLLYGFTRRGQPFYVVFLAFLAGMLAQFFGFRAHVMTIHRRAMNAFRRAYDANDGDGARRALDTLRGISARSAAATLLLYEASILSMEERWAESIEKLDGVDLLRPDARHVVTSTNARAWCYAHVGRAKEAVDLATPNIEAARAAKMQDVAPYVGTLGVAQQLAGDDERAVKTLRTALSMGGDGRMTAIRAFHLGEALRALGRLDDARAAYRRAAEAQPGGRWGRRAQERLQALGAEPYRH